MKASISRDLVFARPFRALALQPFLKLVLLKVLWLCESLHCIFSLQFKLLIRKAITGRDLIFARPICKESISYIIGIVR